ncbi:MAG: hypothetical protein D6698_06415 [Gammaproteobacteria bacterium]|nr:MAG: hypothetical protein D6698_06415 [Gammaproteobacteria bacterium]
MEIEVVLGWYPNFSLSDLHRPDGGIPSLAEAIPLLLEQTEQAPSDPFMVLARSGQYFMQCLSSHAGWLLEKREGDGDHHYRALEPMEQWKASSMDPSLMERIFKKPHHRGWYLTRELVTEAMLAYATGRPEPDWLEWERVEV